MAAAAGRDGVGSVVEDGRQQTAGLRPDKVITTGWVDQGRVASVIGMYSAAQQSGNPSPGHLLGIAVTFLLPGLYLLHRRRQLAQEPPMIGRPAEAVARLRLAYLVAGWFCTCFGAFALLVSAMTALTSGR
ncbi:hypothetical protein [Streptomyces sp. NPDC001070]